MQQSIRENLRRQRQVISKVKKAIYAKALYNEFVSNYAHILTSTPNKIGSYYATET